MRKPSKKDVTNFFEVKLPLQEGFFWNKTKLSEAKIKKICKSKI